MWVRRICTTDNDFVTQSKFIKDRFLQKGYKEQYLDKIIHEVGGIPLESCFKDKEHLGYSDRNGDSSPTYMYNIEKLRPFYNAIGTFYV